VRDVGTGYEPPGANMDVDVVIKLENHPKKTFGFQLRNDGNLTVHSNMLKMLQQAFEAGSPVTLEYERQPGQRNSRLIRLITDA
jgi:hypothetical protein